ncbi:rifin, partial [Plasmodium reichenowi]
RFEEYDERMKTTRQKCKDKCDKEIQKIILKDKLEKKLMDKFVTLDTDIQSDAIPTCVCEKSLADKVEKGCLRCGSVFGGGVAPSVGLLGGIGEAAMSAWKVAALKTAILAARKAGIEAGKVAGEAKGTEIVIFVLEKLGVGDLCPDLLKLIGTKIHFTEATKIANAILAEKGQICSVTSSVGNPMCKTFGIKFGLLDANGGPKSAPDLIYIPEKVTEVVKKATGTADALAKDTAKEVTAELTTEKTSVINTIYMSNQTAIIASVIAIVVIVLILVIIYLILRYRRKKKMKKKLQYIKLLEE